MSAPINRKITLIGNGESIIPLNRYSEDDYSIQVESGGVTVNGTLAQFNRIDPLTNQPEVPVWNVLSDADGAPLSAVGTGIYNVDFIPLEGIQLVAEPTGAVVRIMQQGS